MSQKRQSPDVSQKRQSPVVSQKDRVKIAEQDWSKSGEKDVQDKLTSKLPKSLLNPGNCLKFITC